MILYISNGYIFLFYNFFKFLVELFFYNNFFSIGIHGLPHLSSCLFHRKYLLTTKKSKMWAEILS